MAVMFDGVNPNTVPSGANVYAGYVGGLYPTFAPLQAKFPSAKHVSIAVNSSEDAQVLDVENGDATASEVPAWLTRQRARGQVRPTVYCSRVGSSGEGWQDVIRACDAAGVPLPDFWIADYTPQAHGLEGAVAVQWIDHGGYDESVITDPTWPTGVSAPVPPPPPARPYSDSLLLLH